jgi:AcrR family transcriptional regulator
LLDKRLPASKVTSSPFSRSAQHDAKRVAILSEAARLFNTLGVRATTLGDIAECLGLTKTSLYNYVKTKEELIYQCYMAALAQHLEALDELEQEYSSASDRLSAFHLRQFENWLAARGGRGAYTSALPEIASLKEPHRSEVQAQYLVWFKRVRQIIRNGVAAGELRDCDSTSVTRGFLGSIPWTFSELTELTDEQVIEYARQSMDILAHGLSAGSKEYAFLPLTPRGSGDKPGTVFDRDEQNRLKQEAFYKVGTWFFNRQGFAGTSLDEIAEHLNVSKGAFYYHIKNKEDLLFNCYMYSLDIIGDVHEWAAELDASGLEKVDSICRHIYRVQNSEDGPLIRYSSRRALQKKRREKVLQRMEVSAHRFGDFIREGIEDGSVRAVDALVAEHMITDAINASMDMKIWRKIDDIDAAAGDYFDLFINGFLPRVKTKTK